MELKADLMGLLQADAVFMGHLPGGLHGASEVTRQLTPGAFDPATQMLLPCCNLRLETGVPVGPYPAANRQFFTLYFYERPGAGSVALARDRAFWVLDGQGQTIPGVYEIGHVSDLPVLPEPGLKAEVAVSRYQVTRIRRPLE